MNALRVGVVPGGPECDMEGQQMFIARVSLHGAWCLLAIVDQIRGQQDAA